MSDRALLELRAIFGDAAVDEAIWRDIRRFEAAALPAINAAWNLAELGDQDMWAVLYRWDDAGRELHRERCYEALHTMSALLDDETMARCAASLYLHPQLWQPAYNHQHHHLHGHQAYFQSQVLHELAVDQLHRKAPRDWVARVSRRLLTLCTAIDTGGAPDFATCIGYLLGQEACEAAPLYDGLIAGDWQAVWNYVVRLAGSTPSVDSQPSGELTPPILDPWHELGVADRLGTLWQSCGAQYTIALLWWLYSQERLDPPVFRRLLELLPNSLNVINNILKDYLDRSQPPAASDVDPLNTLGAQRTAGEQALIIENQECDRFLADLRRLVDIVLWDMLCDFRPETWPALGQIYYLSGGRYLLRLAEEVEQHGLAQLGGRRYGDPQLPSLLAQLLGVLQRRDDDAQVRLVALLRRLSPTTLLAILPHTPPYEVEICAALGWQSCGCRYRDAAQRAMVSSSSSALIVWSAS